MRCFLLLFFLFFQVSFSLGEAKATSSEINLSNSERGIFTGTKGLGDIQKTVFGQFRLISCSGGIPEDNVLFLMVEGMLFDGWKLQKPLIPHSTGNEILKEEILYPVNSLHEKRFSGYEKEVYFPLLYLLKEGTKDFHIDKKIPVKACISGVCKEDLLNLSLSVKDDTPYPTDICSKMMRRFQMAAKKSKPEDLQVNLSVIDDNYLQLIASFKDDVSYLSVQTNDLDAFDIVKKEFKNNQASLLIKTDTKKVPNSFVVTLISSLGIFETNVNLSKNKYVFLGSNLDVFEIILSGLFLFCFSPLFYLFLSLPKEKQELISQSNKIIKFFGLLFLFLSLLFYICPVWVDFFEIKGIWIFVSFLLVCWLLYRPQFDVKTGALLFLLLPKPYLIDPIINLNVMDSRVFLIFFAWAVIAFLPFVIFRKLPQFFEEIKKLKQYPFLVRLPQIVLLFWLFVSLIGNVVSNETHAKSFQTLKNEKQTVYVSIEKGLCLSCLLNKWSFSYYLNNLSDFNNENVHILTIKSNSEAGQRFLKENKLIDKAQSLLFGPEQPFPEKIDDFVPVEQWSPILKKVMKEKEQSLPILFYKDGY